MNKLLKFALVSAATAGAVVVGWSLVSSTAAPPPHEGSAPGTTPSNAAPPNDLGKEQEKQLLEELAAQLDA